MLKKKLVKILYHNTRAALKIGLKLELGSVPAKRGFIGRKSGTSVSVCRQHFCFIPTIGRAVYSY